MVLSPECSAAICYDRRKWNNVLKVLKKKMWTRAKGFYVQQDWPWSIKSTNCYYRGMEEWRHHCSHELFSRNLRKNVFQISKWDVQGTDTKPALSTEHLVTCGTNARRGLGGLCSTLLGAGWPEDGDEAWHWNVGDRVLCGSHFKCFYNRNLLVGMLALFCCSELLCVYCEMKWGNVTTMLSFLCPWEPPFSVHRSQHRVGHKRQCHGAAF